MSGEQILVVGQFQVVAFLRGGKRLCGKNGCTAGRFKLQFCVRARANFEQKIARGDSRSGARVDGANHAVEGRRDRLIARWRSGNDAKKIESLRDDLVFDRCRFDLGDRLFFGGFVTGARPQPKPCACGKTGDQEEN